MNTAQSFQSGHTGPGESASLSLNLSSNNPFRNRAPSPASADLLLLSSNKPASPFEDPPPRPLSRNPFLDQPLFEQPQQPLRSPGVMSSHSDSKSLSAEEIFDSLTLDDVSANDRSKQQGQRRPMNRPPPPPQTQSGNHRPTRSQEEAQRARKMQQGPGPRPQPNSPQRRPPPRRVRRNSESSLMDFDARPLTDEEKRMIEAARRREAERRGDGKERGDKGGRDRDRDRERERERGDRDRERDRGDKSKPNRPSRRMDIIDQLDATSIYGTGLFHHDGPFDALNPHRNRQNARRAPMQAFPKDSLNNSLGGAGPLNAQADHSTFMGNATDEAFRDFAAGSKGMRYGGSSRKETPIFDATGREVVHGDESHGLGTSTFLEGTPASRTAIQRSQAEQAQESFEGGLQRKKSLAQRIRHINKGPRGYDQTRIPGEYNRITPDNYPSAASNGSDNNPFFAEFGKGEEGFSVRPRDGRMSPNSPPAPRRPSAGAVLERRATADGATTLDDGAAKPSGFMGRMKSLKGRRPRPEIPANGTAPGTAV